MWILGGHTKETLGEVKEGSTESRTLLLSSGSQPCDFMRGSETMLFETHLEGFIQPTTTHTHTHTAYMHRCEYIGAYRSM